MKRVMCQILLLSLAFFPTPAWPSDWTIDPEHSRARFKIRHLLVGSLRGHFSEVHGRAVIDDTDITRSSIEVTIVAESIDTGMERRDRLLRDEDFFHVAKFPSLSFKSGRIEHAGDGRLVVTGYLTIHGITREWAFLVDGLLNRAVTDSRGQASLRVLAVATVNRKEFDIVWHSFLDRGGVVISNQVEITLDVGMIRQKP